MAYFAQAETPHIYTAEELAQRWQGVVHPGENPRGEAFLKSVKLGGFYVGCGAAMAAYANDGLGKVFHEHVIGATVAQFDLDPNRPEFVRYGSFSNDVPQRLWGIAAYTTGRDKKDPNHLMPDATGLGLRLMQGENWISWSSTASRAAFARRGANFPRLTGFPAIARALLGFMSPTGLFEAHQGRSAGIEQPDNPYRQRPGWFRRLALGLGGMLGEGAFVLADPSPGFGTLVPAILSGRRSPFPGFSDVGYGADTRLLSDAFPLDKRRAYRLTFKLADNETNRQLLEEIPGWIATFDNNLRGTPANQIYSDSSDETRILRRKHLTAQFNKWIQRKGIQIVYDVYIQLDDPEHPDLTPIELSHKGWYSPKIRVATLTLHSIGEKPALGQALNEFANQMHLSPAESMHLPVGDLAWYRSVGRLIGRADKPVTVADTRDGTQGETAIGAYAQSRDLRTAPDPVQEMRRLRSLFAEAGIDIGP